MLIPFVSIYQWVKYDLLQGVLTLAFGVVMIVGYFLLRRRAWGELDVNAVGRRYE